MTYGGRSGRRELGRVDQSSKQKGKSSWRNQVGLPGDLVGYRPSAYQPNKRNSTSANALGNIARPHKTEVANSHRGETRTRISLHFLHDGRCPCFGNQWPVRTIAALKAI